MIRTEGKGPVESAIPKFNKWRFSEERIVNSIKYLDNVTIICKVHENGTLILAIRKLW